MAEICVCGWQVTVDQDGLRTPVRRLVNPDCNLHGKDEPVTPKKSPALDDLAVAVVRAFNLPDIDAKRRAKHLTDAECAAMYWASHGTDTMGEGALYWAPLSKRLTIFRFAVHDQAV